MDKRIIVRNFSRYAHTYDQYADIQNKCAKELLGLVKGNGVANILEIGCGTGNFTHLLKEKFKKAKIKAIDISGEMIKVAQGKLRNRRVEFICQDAERLDLQEEFGLVASNACLQWLENPLAALADQGNFITVGGRILFSVFGPKTFNELNYALAKVLKKAPENGINFLNRSELSKVLKANFQEYSIKERIYEEEFSSLRMFLEKIKYTGIRGNGFRSRGMFTPELLNKIEDAYRDKFRSIKVTYQVFLCQAVK